MEQLEHQITELQDTLRKMSNSQAVLKADAQLLEQEKTANQREYARIKIIAEESKNDMLSSAEGAKSNQAQLNSVRKQISDAQANIARIRPQIEELKGKDGEIRTKLDVAIQRRTTLIQKQGQAKRFVTVAERDASIKDEIKEVEAAKAEQQKTLKEAESNLGQKRQSLTSKEQEIAALKADLEKRRLEYVAFTDEERSKKIKVSEAVENRK